MTRHALERLRDRYGFGSWEKVEEIRRRCRDHVETRVTRVEVGGEIEHHEMEIEGRRLVAVYSRVTGAVLTVAYPKTDDRHIARRNHRPSGRRLDSTRGGRVVPSLLRHLLNEEDED